MTGRGAASARTIRVAQLSDTAAVEAVVREAYQPYVARLGRPPAPMTSDYARVIRDAIVSVLELDDRVRGVVVLQPYADHLLIDALAVDPQWQGSGAGSQLLRYAEQPARDRGLPEVRLYTNEQMTENLRYYPRRGYLETGRRVVDGYARVFFSKRLPPA